MNRRNLLKFGLSLPFFSLVEAKEQIKNKNVIVLFLGGGMSHSDNFNIAPDAVDRYKAINGFIPIRQGFIGSDWTELAKISQLYTLVHSFGHINPGHQGGTAYVMNGYNFTDENQGAQQTHPSPGSFVSKEFGTMNRGIPSYVATATTFGMNASYLGNIYNPFSLTEGGKRDLAMNVSEDRLRLRKAMLDLVNRYKNVPDYVDSHKEQAFKLITGDSRKVFDIANEPESMKALYGQSNIGEQLLLARRLIENGTRFVTANHGGWDMHQNISKGLNNLVPEVDKALSGLLIDLSQRGLLKDTLVVVCTEFGRTMLNIDAGRNHYSRVTSLLLAGGNYGDSVIGKMDKNGFEVADKPYSPLDLLYTIIHHVGINHRNTNTDLAGRPRYVVDGEAKLIV